MEKKFRITKKQAVLAGLLLLVIAALIYTRPMTAEQLCPGFDFSQCTEIYTHYSPKRAEDVTENIILGPEDPEFQRFIDLFETRTFRRSLRDFLPFNGEFRRTTSVQSWRTGFWMETVETAEGKQITPFFECWTFGNLRMEMNYPDKDGNLRRVPCMYIGNLSWSNEVLELAKAAKEARVESEPRVEAPSASVAPLEFCSFEKLAAAVAETDSGENNGELAGLTHYYVPTIPGIVLDSILLKERYLCTYYRIGNTDEESPADPDEAEIALISGTVKLEWVRNADGNELLANTKDMLGLKELQEGVYYCDITYPTQPDVILSKSLYWVYDGYMLNLDIPLAMYEALIAEHGTVDAIIAVEKVPMK